MADDPAATRTRARIPTAAEVKKAAARLTGRADDETEDNAASPFDTAEIPVPHSREYERAEDAPAIRALLAKKRARAGIACIVSGAMSLVMIVLALLPVRPAALNDPMVYPAAGSANSAVYLTPEELERCASPCQWADVCKLPETA